MNKTGELYNILALICRIALVLLSNVRNNCLFFKKLFIQLTSFVKILRVRKLCINLSCKTLSNTPATLRLKINATFSILVFYIVCIYSTSSFRADFVKR